MNIERILRLPRDISKLVLESEQEGFKFLRRLVSDFEDGSNLFVGAGECLLAVKDGGNLIAIGGLNKSDVNTGRLRRIFVSRECRNRGIGKLLITTLENHAVKSFKEVVLYTDSFLAAKFYESRGYSAVGEHNVSHRKKLSE